MSYVGEDFVKNFTAGDLSALAFTFSDLPAGTFTVTGYFLDATNAQFENIHVAVTDVNGGPTGAGQVGEGSLAPGNVNSLTTALVTASSIMDFTFVSNGSDDVTLLFNTPGSTLGIEMPISGLSLEFTPVPEPSSALMFLVVGLVCQCLHRRNR